MNYIQSAYRGVMATLMLVGACFGASASLEDATEYPNVTIGDKSMRLSQRWAVELDQSDNGDYAGAFAVTGDVVYVLDASNGGKQLSRYKTDTGATMSALTITYTDEIADPGMALSQVGVDDDGTLFVSYKSTYTGNDPWLYIDIVDTASGTVTQRLSYRLKTIRAYPNEAFTSCGFSQPRVEGSMLTGSYTISLLEIGGELSDTNQTYAFATPSETLSLGRYQFVDGSFAHAYNPALIGLSPADNYMASFTPWSLIDNQNIYLVDAHGKRAMTYKVGLNDSLSPIEYFGWATEDEDEDGYEDLSGGNGSCHFELNGQSLIVQGISCGDTAARWRLSTWPGADGKSFMVFSSADYQKLVDFPASDSGLGTSSATNPSTLCQAREVSGNGEIFLYSPGAGLACYDLKEPSVGPVTPPSGGGGSLEDTTQYPNIVIGQKNTTFGQRWAVELDQSDNGDYAGAFAVTGDVVYVLDASNGGKQLSRYKTDTGATMSALTITYTDEIADPGMALSQVGVDDDGTLFVSYKSTYTDNDPWLYIDIVDTASGTVTQRLSYRLKTIRAYPDETFTSCGFSQPRVEGSLLNGSYTISLLEIGGELSDTNQTYAFTTPSETLSLGRYQFVDGSLAHAYNPALKDLSPADNYMAFFTPWSLIDNQNIYLVDAHGKRAMTYKVGLNDSLSPTEYFGTASEDEDEDGYEDLSGGNGSCHFELNGQSLILQGISCGDTAARWRLSTWPEADGKSFMVFSSADYQKLVDFPASDSGLGTSSASNPSTLCQARVVNGIGEVYIYSPGSGIARYDLGEPMSNAALWPIDDASPLLTVAGRNFVLSEACEVSVISLDGRLAYSVIAHEGALTLPSSLKGFYVVTATSLSTGRTAVVKVAL